MSIPDIERELADLLPRESAAWQEVKKRTDDRDKAYSLLRSQLEQIHPEAAKDIARLEAVWSPLYRRRQKLESFLELAK